MGSPSGDNGYELILKYVLLIVLIDRIPQSVLTGILKVV